MESVSDMLICFYNVPEDCVWCPFSPNKPLPCHRQSDLQSSSIPLSLPTVFESGHYLQKLKGGRGKAQITDYYKSMSKVDSFLSGVLMTLQWCFICQKNSPYLNSMWFKPFFIVSTFAWVMASQSCHSNFGSPCIFKQFCGTVDVVWRGPLTVCWSR